MRTTTPAGGRRTPPDFVRSCSAEAGRITDKTETTSSGTETIEYAYDDAGRLEQVTRDGNVTATYTFDSNGNRTSVTRAGEGTTSATYDAQDRISTYGDLEYEFTENGDLASKTDSGSNDTTTYDYDPLGNLDSIELPSAQTVSYLTDGLGRRVGRKVDGQLTHGYLYGSEAMGPVAELDAQGAVRSRFVYATSPVVPDYMVRNGNTYRLIRDQLGSPRLVVDANSGTIAQALDYDEFGRVTDDTSPGFQPFGFAGGLYDPATRLTRFGARDYDAEIGRWTARDPIRFEGGDPNLYGYVLGDPVNLSDPAGTSLLDEIPPPWKWGPDDITHFTDDLKPFLKFGPGQFHQSWECGEYLGGHPDRDVGDCDPWELWSGEEVAKAYGEIQEPCDELGTDSDGRIRGGTQ